MQDVWRVLVHIHMELQAWIAHRLAGWPSRGVYGVHELKVFH
jgi:hypothetical protein